ncbi:MAG: DUF1704 domain-containing protein [Myxococcales bacterium]|nr:DUF1704 domain-containing protein [Myxococcales bacterium]
MARQLGRSRAQLELDARLRLVAKAALRLPALVGRGVRDERARLLAKHARRERLDPSWAIAAEPVAHTTRRALDDARALAREVEGQRLYLERLDELDLELDVLESFGDPRRTRALARRRWPTGRTEVVLGRRATLRSVADALLEEVRLDAPEPPTVEARALAGMVRALAAHAGIAPEVKIEPGLVANAAAGERTVFLADRRFGAREARRLAVHEVLGHLVAAANGRAQPLALLSVGTAGAFEDQEGLALTLEEEAGLLDGRRARTFAARVIATDAVHDGADPSELVVLLERDHGFEPEEAIALVERAFRGGGLARDASYLFGWVRVRRALTRGATTVDELRWGKVALGALEGLRALLGRGALRPPGPHRPSLAESLAATGPGTSAFTSPPSFAASLMRFEET